MTTRLPPTVVYIDVSRIFVEWKLSYELDRNCNGERSFRQASKWKDTLHCRACLDRTICSVATKLRPKVIPRFLETDTIVDSSHSNHRRLLKEKNVSLQDHQRNLRNESIDSRTTSIFACAGRALRRSCEPCVSDAESL